MDILDEQVENSDIERLLEEYQSGAAAYADKIGQFLARAREINTLDVVQPPVSWAQDLNRVQIEVKFAHRFDAPGCANHTDVNIKVEEKQLSLTVLCLSISSKIKYVLDLPLWAPIEVEESSYTYQAVGKYHFSLVKGERPARWAQIHHADYPKPFNTRLHLEWHQQYARTLLDFGDGDSVTEFPGYDYLQEEHEDELEKKRQKDLPKKGPIPLKKKKKSKKKRDSD